MRDLYISFSGRISDGNSMTIINYMAEKSNSSEYEIIKLKDLNINSCSKCDYDCFYSKQCPYEDDMKDLFNKVISCDRVFFIIPIYNSFASSLYLKFKERLQSHIFTAEYSKYEKTEKRYIIIGNLSSGAAHTINWIKDEEKVDENNIVLLQSSDYKSSAIRDRLIDKEEVKSIIYKLWSFPNHMI